MTRMRGIITLVWLVLVFAGAHVWTKHAGHDRINPDLTVSPAIHTSSVFDKLAKQVESVEEVDADSAEPRVDVNGNEIDDAVSDYRVDREGALYERHAPDTELPRLDPPEL
jgi:hypothetical protein